MNKKADITFLTVIILVSIISFGVVGIYIIETNEIVSTSKDDVLCNTLIQLKGNNLYSIVDLFYQINTRCKVDSILIDSENENDVFKKFADSSVSCYDRYGKGEFDFLEKYKAEGNWCFLCGEVSFENNVDFNANYFDFIEWTKKISLPENDSISYYDYTNFVYSSVNEDNIGELESLEEDISSLISEVSEGDFPELMDVSLLTLEKYQTIVDYQLKNFDSSQTYYVTYRYDRLPNIDDRLQDAGDAAQSAIIGGLIASAGTEIALGFVTGGVGFIKASLTISSKLLVISKLNTIFSKMKNFVSYSKVEKSSEYLDNTITISSTVGKTVKISEKLTKFNPTPDDLRGFSELLKLDSKYAELGNRFNNIAEFMDKKNIKSFNDLDKVSLDKEIIEDIKYFVKADIPASEGATAQKLQEQVKNMQSFASDDILKLSSNDPSFISKSMSTIKNTLRVTAFGTGAFLGLVYEEDDNPYNQYVDIMTQEEFYRNCGFPAGTDPIN